MANRIIIIGVVLVVVGVGLLSPLYDYLPIDFWESIKAMLGLRPPLEGGKIIEVERNVSGEFSSISMGIILILIGVYLKSSS